MTTQERTQSPTGLRRLLDPTVLADPYPLYEEWRGRAERDPTDPEIARVIVRHDEAKAALRDKRLSSWRVPQIFKPLSQQARDELVALREHIEANIVFNDPPPHQRLRRLMAKAFTARTVEWLRPQIAELTDELFGRVAGAGRMDFIADVAYRLPALVVGAMLGVPRPDLPAFEKWAYDLVFFVGSGKRDDDLARRMQSSVLEARAFLADLCARRRDDPGEDLLTAMMAARDEGGDRLSDVELYANAQFLLTAGHETATNMLANTLLALLRHPDQLSRLQADRGLLQTTVDEGLRYESPVQMTARIATGDCEVAGRRLAEGSSVVVAIGAANRDPAVFSGPDRFDVGRAENPHLAFGHGTHFCLGAPLARVESEIVLGAVLDRLPDIALAVDPASLEWQQTTDFRGLVALPVTF